MRTGSANANHTAVQTLAARQARIEQLQEQVSSGRRIQRVSDDPAAAARAERSRNALSRIAADQRGLQDQRNALQLAEAALGRSVDLLQRARELLVQSQNGTLGARDRLSIATELAGLREQLLAEANQRDANGVALFGGLSTRAEAFVQGAGGVAFTGEAGQALATASAVPGAMDGSRVWMDLRGGNGAVEITPDAATPGGAWLDAGEVTDPSSLTGHDYEVVFSVAGGVTTVSVNNLTLGTTVVAAQPFAAPPSGQGATLEFDGLRIRARGTPADGERFTVAPSQRTDLFAVMERAITALSDGSTPPARSVGTVTRTLRELEQGLDRVMLARTVAGDWLARADAIETAQQDTAAGVEQVRAQAEDTDLMRTLSELQNASGTLDIALKSYAQIQRISLFNYIAPG